MDERGETPRAPVTTVDSVVALDDASLRTLGETVGDDPELLVTLVDACLDDATIRLAELASGLESADAVLLGRAAHTLKANALTFGALGLAELCQRLELNARSGDLDDAPLLVERIEREWLVVEPLLDDLRRKWLS